MYLQKINKQKIKVSFLLASVTKVAGSESGYGSIFQRHGSADPDPHQKVINLGHWSKYLPQMIS
jgi:hypothetical protein